MVPRAELEKYPLADYMPQMLQVFESEEYSELLFYNDDGLRYMLF